MNKSDLCLHQIQHILVTSSKKPQDYCLQQLCRIAVRCKKVIRLRHWPLTSAGLILLSCGKWHGQLLSSVLCCQGTLMSLWLVNTDHVTWILASDWLVVTWRQKGRRHPRTGGRLRSVDSVTQSLGHTDTYWRSYSLTPALYPVLGQPPLLVSFSLLS